MYNGNMKTKEQILDFANKKIIFLEKDLKSSDESNIESIKQKIRTLKWRITNIDKYIELCRNSVSKPEYHKKWREDNKEKLTEEKRLYYINNKEHCDSLNKEWKTNNPDKVKELHHKNYLDNKDKYNLLNKKYHKENKDSISIIKHEYYLSNKERILARNRRWKETHLEQWFTYRHSRAFKDSANAYKRDKYLNDIQYNITHKLRNRVYCALDRAMLNKQNHLKELIGCDYDFLKEHLQKQFKDDMTWDLLLEGKIHIDHIRPCSSFNLEDENEQKLCFHYLNLQPLWSEDNLKKSDGWISIDQQELLCTP